MNKKRNILIEDSTLREGEQTPGVAFTYDQKYSIICGLENAGVRHIEVGTPAMGSTESQLLQRLVEDFKNLTLIGWNRGVKTDIQQTIDAGFKALHIGLPSSDIHIKDKFKKDKNWVLDIAAELVTYAKSQGVTFISVSAEDMGRADLEFLKKYARLMADCGVSRMRLSDTVGCLTPERVTKIVSCLKNHVDIDYQLHMHNDFNLAIANVLAGVAAGASQVHATINGIGERAGLASLHQVATALAFAVNDIDTGIDLKQLPKLSKTIEQITGLHLAYNEPVLGKHAFTHESGIHVDGILKIAKSFEAYPPEAVGRKHSFQLGKHSGSAGIQHMLAANGLAIDRETAKSLLPLIRDIAPVVGGTIEVELIKHIAIYMSKMRDVSPA